MNQLKKSQTASFLVLLAVYLLATAVGVVTYLVSELPWWLSLLIADVAATVAVFVFSLIFSNASVYDPYWSVQPPVILVAFAIGQGGVGLFGGLMLAVVSFWAIRLTANWAYTFGDLTHQDWRYTMLKEKTGVFYPVINFVGIHLVPTLVVYGCVLPAVYVILHEPPINPLSLLCLGISLSAAILQGIADVQMHTFRKDRRTPFIRVGLWKHSRHPNYLGEILMWWGIGLSAVLAAPDVWYLLAGAVANQLLFLCVSIPLADGRQSRKEGFADYKRETRILLPLKKFRKGK